MYFALNIDRVEIKDFTYLLNREFLYSSQNITRPFHYQLFHEVVICDVNLESLSGQKVSWSRVFL